MKDITEANAHLVGSWLQLLAAGAYLRFFTAMRQYTHKAPTRRSVPLDSCGMRAHIPGHMINIAASLVRSYKAFALDGDRLPNPTAGYADSSAITSLLKNWMNVAVSLISDIIIVYRTYIIWNASPWVVLVPFGLLLGAIALGIWAAWSLTQTKTDSIPVLAAVSLRVREFYILSFCINLLCAGLISWKIWRVQSAVSRISGMASAPKTTNALEIIIQTAALYCAHLLALIITQCLNTNYFFLFLDPITPVADLIFTMLIVRARVGGDTDIPAGVSSVRFNTTTHPTVRTVNLELGTRRADLVEERLAVDEDGMMRSKGSESLTPSTGATVTCISNDFCRKRKLNLGNVVPS